MAQTGLDGWPATQDWCSLGMGDSASLARYWTTSFADGVGHLENIPGDEAQRVVLYV